MKKLLIALLFTPLVVTAYNNGPYPFGGGGSGGGGTVINNIITNQVTGVGGIISGSLTNVSVGPPGTPSYYPISRINGVVDAAPLVLTPYPNLSLTNFEASCSQFVAGTNIFVNVVSNLASATSPSTGVGVVGNLTNIFGGGGGTSQSSLNVGGNGILNSNCNLYLQLSNNSAGSVTLPALNFTLGIQVPTSIASIVSTVTATNINGVDARYVATNTTIGPVLPTTVSINETNALRFGGTTILWFDSTNETLMIADRSGPFSWSGIAWNPWNAGSGFPHGIDSVYIGSGAGQDLQNGSGDNYIGFNAGWANQSGNGNNAMGDAAFSQISMVGSENTVIGDQSMGGSDVISQNNTVIGAGCLENAVNTSNNIVINAGDFTGAVNWNGNESSNILIGSPGVSGDLNLIRIGQSQLKTYISGSVFASGFIVHSNAWSLANQTNGMINWDIKYTASNGVPVYIYFSNGIPFVNYFNTAGQIP